MRAVVDIAVRGRREVVDGQAGQTPAGVRMAALRQREAEDDKAGPMQAVDDMGALQQKEVGQGVLDWIYCWVEGTEADCTGCGTSASRG